MSRIIRALVSAVAVGSIAVLGVAGPTAAPGSGHDSVQADPHWCC
jgi:hypothetical protein